MRAPLAVTLGEPAGIGPDITIAAWLRRHELDLPPFFVLGDPDFYAARARFLDVSIPVSPVAPEETRAAFDHALPVLDLGLDVPTGAGHPDAFGARAALKSIERAVAELFDGKAGAMVTNPIAKSVLYQHGLAVPGHTEFLAQLASERTGQPVRSAMMLWSEELSVVPVTIHVALREVPRLLTTDLIVETALMAISDLQTRFRVRRPRLAVSGLNPHAGENATIGGEERDIIVPAIERLRAEGIDARGPFAADSMFHLAARATYDLALTMYHDQALIPIKTMAFDHAVNVTLGLPFVRTSPDHGTAFDLAGTGRANPASFIAALRLAARIGAQTRVAHAGG